MFGYKLSAPVVELVDTADSKSAAERRSGSIPDGGTKKFSFSFYLGMLDFR